MDRNLQPQLRRTRLYQASNRLHNPVGSPDSPHNISYALSWKAFSYLAPFYHLGDCLPHLGPWPDPPLGEEVPPGSQGGSLVTHNIHISIKTSQWSALGR